MYRFSFGKLHKCPICKKEFWVTDSDQWVYRTNTKNAAVFVYLLPYFSEKKSIQHGEINNLAAGEEINKRCAA